MTTKTRRGRPTRIEEAAAAWAQWHRRGRRGRMEEALLLAGASPTTQAVLDFIREFKKQEHMAPTVREIQVGCDLSSTSVVDYQLELLEDRHRAITRKPNVARSIMLAKEAL